MALVPKNRIIGSVAILLVGLLSGGSPWRATLLAFLPVVLEFLLRRKFHVHTKGCILLTGASSGIGYDATLALSKLGFIVFAGVRKNTDMTRLKEQADSIKPIRLDVTQQADILNAGKQIEDFLKSTNLPLVAVVNSAGIAPNTLWEGVDMKTVQEVYSVNVFGALAVTKRFLPLLRRDKGRIINISSGAPYVNPPGSGLYASSKAALKSISDSLRREVASLGVSVSDIEPAFTKTPLLEKQEASENAIAAGDYATIYSHLVQGQKERRIKVLETSQDVSCVTPLIVESILDPYPLTRYRVGNVAGKPLHVMLFLLGIFPDRLKDKIIKTV